MQEPTIFLTTPGDAARGLAERARSLRLMRGWKRETLAQRAGVSASSLKRFETTGEASLALVLRVAFALGHLDDFTTLLQAPNALSLDELEGNHRQALRKRGSR